MRITFIINTLESGGAERVLATLADEMSKKHQVKVLVFTKKEAFYSFEKDVDVHYLSDAPNTFFGKVEQVFRSAIALRREQTDVLVSFLTTINFVSLIFKPISIPIVVCERNAHYRLKNRFWRVFRVLIYRMADALTVQFSDDAVYYRKWLRNVAVFRNPCSFTGQVGIFDKENLVILVSRLHATKNIPMFLRAISLLDVGLRSSYRFCVLGEGELREQLIQETKKMDIFVEFLASVKNVEDYYRKAKVICLCSHVEGMPNVLIESLFFEVARISTKSSGGTLSLIEDGVDGFLVEKDDARAMSERMARLMRDEDLRLRIVEQANRKRKLFDVKNIESQWMDLIHRVRERRGREQKTQKKHN